MSGNGKIRIKDHDTHLAKVRREVDKARNSSGSDAIIEQYLKAGMDEDHPVTQHALWRSIAYYAAAEVVALRADIKDRDQRVEALSLELELAKTMYVANAILVPTEEDGR